LKKLSAAGKLYLQDFYILNEAQNDIFSFLDAVVEQSYQTVEGSMKDLHDPDELFNWSIWKYKTNPGKMEIWPWTKKEIYPFGKNKQDLYMVYCDVRHDPELSDTAAVSITVRCTNMFLRSLKQLSAEDLRKAQKAAEPFETIIDLTKRNVLSKEEIKLNLDSTSDSADSIAEIIAERCRGLKEFALQIVKQG